MSSQSKVDLLDAAVALSLAVLGVSVVLGSRSLGIGSLAEPGPGFIPALGGVLSCALGTLCLLRSLVIRHLDGEREKLSVSHLKAVAIAIALIIYALSVELIGFLPLTVLLGFFVLQLAKPGKVIAASFVAFAFSIGAWLLFGKLLRVSLPTGAIF